MGNIIRRNKAVPVEARRVEPAPDMVSVPGAGPVTASGPVQVPPVIPGVTQNIYVNVREGQAAAQAASAPPGAVHYHQHTTNVYHLPGRRRSGRGTSFLGTLGFVLGGVAAGTAYVPQIVWLAKPIAMAGFASAGLGFLAALLLGRVGRLMPFVGLLTCALAYGLWLKNTGQPIPKIDFNISSAPASPTAPTVANSPPVTSTPTPARDHSIFGDNADGWGKPSPAMVPADGGPTPTPAPLVPAQAIDLATATANLENARNTAAQKMGLDYQSAKSAAADADAKYQQAKIDQPLGSAELVSLNQLHLDADSRLNEMQEKLRTDPAVVAAERAVKSATASPR
jgi:hypothetical protein